MIKQVCVEMRNCFNQITFKVAFGAMLLSSVGAFLMVCFQNYGMDYTFIRSSYDEFMLLSPSLTPIAMLLTMFFPLLSMMFYAASFRKDEETGIARMVFTRTSKRKYFYGKAIAVFIVTFLAFFIPIVLNQVLNSIASPVTGYDSNRGTVIYDLKRSYDPSFAFDFYRVQSPFIYNMIYAISFSVLGGIVALFCYGISLLPCIKKIGTFKLVISLYILFLLAGLIGQALGVDIISYVTMLEMETVTKAHNIFIYGGVLLAVSVVMIVIGARVYEEKM